MYYFVRQDGFVVQESGFVDASKTDGSIPHSILRTPDPVSIRLFPRLETSRRLRNRIRTRSRPKARIRRNCTKML